MIAGNVVDDFLTEYSNRVSTIKRAAISHRIQSNQGKSPPVIEEEGFESLLKEIRLPSPAQQATNVVRYIGDRVSETGEPLPTLPQSFFSQIGSPNPRFAESILEELHTKGLVIGSFTHLGSGSTIAKGLNLTLEGWERYEAEKRGKIAGAYGFLAMKFGDAILEPFAKNVIKPAISQLGFDLIDIRDAARSGIIDNIMREKIRDAAFVLVDLTHDNSGAYWEAGFAEGLGKPVLYLCEHSKFESAKTHFDTNHCTTVTWRGVKTDQVFAQELQATLRNSLQLFPTK